MNLYISWQIIPNRPSAPTSISRITQFQIIQAIIMNQDLQQVISDPLANNGGQIFMDGQIVMTRESGIGQIIVYIFSLVMMQIDNGDSPQDMKGEHYFIIMQIVFGQTYQISSIDWVITILSWEQFNLSLYQFIGQDLRSSGQAPIASGIQYFLLSVFTTGFLLLSIGIIYSQTGNTSYDSNIIQQKMASPDNIQVTLSQILIIFVQGFKQGLAPQHSWSPDLYDGQKGEYASWLMTVPKIGQLIFMINISEYISSNGSIILGMISQIIGSIGQSSQYKIRRFLAYSSISNLGFIFIIGPAADGIGNQDNASYLTYSIVYLLSVAIILLIIATYPQRLNYIHDLSGLMYTNPSLYAALLITLFSMAGIPPQAGFYIKQLVIIEILNSGISAQLQIIATIIIASIISACNYISIITITQVRSPLHKSNYTCIRAIGYSNSILITSQIGIVLILSQNMVTFII